MKTVHLSIIGFTILLLVPLMMNNQAIAPCMPNPDWPRAPCYGCAMCIPSIEKQREDWIPYYDYKGAVWMEMMKTQMIEAMKNGTIEDWVTGNQSNYDVWRYYYVNDEAPFFRSSVSGLNDEHPYFPPPLQQLTTGIAPKDVVCKKGLNLVIKAEDGSPACVKPDTVQKLIERGWGTLPLHGLPIFPTVGNATKPTSGNIGSLPPPTPANAIPPFEILLNGSSVYPSYHVSKGEKVVIFVDITSKLTYPLSLSAHYQSPDRKLPSGVTLNLSMKNVTAPISHIPLVVSISQNASTGLVPMAVDATYYNNTEKVGFQAGFNLYITQ